MIQRSRLLIGLTASAALAAFVALPTSPAVAQETPGALATMLETTRPLKDLQNGEYRRMTIRTAAGSSGGGMGGPMAMLAGMFGGGMEGPFKSIFSGLATAGPDVYYSQGATTKLGEETFLIAYQPVSPPIDVLAMMKSSEASKPPVPKALTADSPVQAVLINVRQIGSISEVRKFDLQAELADSQKQVRAIAAMGNEGSPDTAPVKKP